ncbi:MAG TPA: AAA family ATPase [Myxococcaceae bacterium]|nr:AAA family ATPase [Myxococcaceae bacterium]
MTPSARALSPAQDTLPASAAMERVERNLACAVAGKDEELRLSVACLVARGHLLLEDVPGVGKTTLAEAIARSFGLSFARVQFTSDLMPADILGAQVFHPQSSTFELRKGPLFHQLVLADELNRAPPRTQSALLEAMAQGQASLDGITHVLPAPFTVIATQNPTDLAGTYPLPDSQLDRFLMRISLGHPAPEIEASLLQTRAVRDPLHSLEAVSSPEELMALQAAASRVAVGDAVAAYAVRLAEATRRHPEIERGASTRALLSLMNAARAHALREGRSFVTPADVRRMLAPCLAHRLLLRSALTGSFSRDEAAHLLGDVVRSIPEPR